MERNSDTIIMAYKQADADVTELIKYVESISTPQELNDLKLPSLVKNLQNKDSSISQKYIDMAHENGVSIIVSKFDSFHVATRIALSNYLKSIKRYPYRHNDI